MSRQEIKEQYRKNTTTDQFMLQHDEYKRQNLCRDRIFSYHDTDYCNLENPIETLYEEVLSRQGNECRDNKRQGFWS